MKKLQALFLVSGFLLLFSAAGFAQQAASNSGQTGTDQDIKLLRSDLQSDRKQIVAQNMQLTDKQAEKFWPVYDAYTQETTKLGDTLQGILKDYAQNYNTMTDAQAQDLLKRMLALEKQRVDLAEQWVPKFDKVLPGKQTALFFQIDHRITLIRDLQLASIVPLVQ